jgi:ABC-type transporter Mla MlaB component
MAAVTTDRERLTTGRDERALVGRRRRRRAWREDSRSRSNRIKYAGGRSRARGAGVECLMEIVDSSDRRLIRLAGRLTAAQIPDLLQAHASAERQVFLHLGDLVSVDAAGLDVLCRLQRSGTPLVDVPVYIQLKIDAAISRDLPPSA